MKICKRIKATVLALCLVIGMCAVSFPQTVHAEYGDNAYAFMKQLQSNYPYRQVNSSNGMLSGAEEWLKAQIATMGYEYMAQPFTMTSADGVTPCYGENLIFSKQGASDRVIVVGAHYDCVEQTFGTDDNASGVGVLLELASIYSTKESPYTIRFILFSAEEPGCLGSQYYVDNLSQEERDRIACMINIDTIAAGDNMYLYGGTVDDSGSIVQDWAVYQAQSAADLLGIDMSFHPDVNDSFPTPTKATASDQMPFANVGIPYIYCEASNWNGEPYTNFYQTSNSAVDGGTIMHKAEYDNLTFIENTFGTRAYEHLQAYAKLLDYLLENMKEGEYATGYTFEDTNTKATTTSSVYLRERPTQYESVSYIAGCRH
ncbi:MAG: M28 family metallopeptidase [Lachnospiraceae bacterium]